MIFYALAFDNSFTQKLEEYGCSWLGNIDFKTDMAPTIIYVGDSDLCASENGELINPASNLKHFASQGFTDLGMYCKNEIDFLKKLNANTFDSVDIKGCKGLRYNPINWN
jgi:hypothetical protein